MYLAAAQFCLGLGITNREGGASGKEVLTMSLKGGKSNGTLNEVQKARLLQRMKGKNVKIKRKGRKN